MLEKLKKPAIKNHILESRLFWQRSIIALILVSILLFVLLGRFYYLQVKQHDNYQTLSNKNRLSIVPLAPTRGLIYDRNGILLAENRPNFTLEIIPEKVRDLDLLFKQLNEFIAISEQEIQRFNKRKRQKRRFQGVILRDQLSEEEVARYAVNQHRFPAVKIQAELIRYYPYAEITAHALGYIGRINEQDLARIDPVNYQATRYIGKLGIEKSYEDILHGSIGHQEVETNVQGRILRVLEKKPAQTGSDLHLHLDIKLQQKAYEAMQDIRGAIVAIDVNTGGVLALVSNPGFDSNLFVGGIDSKRYKQLRDARSRPLFNRALRGQYPPGSTIKPFIGLTGLETGVINQQSRILDPGFYQLNKQGRKYRDHKKQGHGWVNVKKAIRVSCDTFYYQLAYKLGIDRIHQHMIHYGFGAKTNIDIDEEVSAIMPSRAWKRAARDQVWFPGETLNIGIGQGFWTATPLQLAHATAAFAAQGKRYEPRIVQAQSQGNQENIVAIPTVNAESQPTISQIKHWQHIHEAMYSVTQPGGTAYRAFADATYQSAGKTGTAQLFSLKEDEEYDEKKVAKHLRDNALYVSYAPVDKPEIALAVIAENAGHGGAAAAPIARKILDFYFANKK